MKKVISALLAAVLCCVMTAPASARVLTDEEVQELYDQQENDLARASRYFATRMVWAAAGKDGVIEFGFDVVCPRIMNRVGATEIEILRKSGDNWITVKTYKYTDPGLDWLYTYNEGAFSRAIYFQGTSNREYLAYITVQAEDDDGLEARIMPTNRVITN